MTDEFAPLKKVFGLDLPSDENQRRAVELLNNRYSEPGIDNATDPADVETQRAARREQMDREQAAGNRGDHPHQLAAREFFNTGPGPMIINAAPGQQCEVINPQLIQLTREKIVKIATIRRACYIDETQEVMITFEAAPGQALTLECFPDPNRLLWQQLELAATHAIVLSSPKWLPRDVPSRDAAAQQSHR